MGHKKMRWFIVKFAAPQTLKACPDYLGLGGDAWPLMDHTSWEMRRFHARFEDARSAIALEHSTPLLCTDLGLACEYKELARRAFPESRVDLLALSRPEGGHKCLGFDISNPDGGFSLLEAEVLISKRKAPLNRFGLFDNISNLEDYLEGRAGEEHLEEAHFLEWVSIELIS